MFTVNTRENSKMRQVYTPGLPIVIAAIVVSSCANLEEAQRPIVPLSEPPPVEAGIAPVPGEYPGAFDALSYHVSLTLPDTGSFILGTTTATILVRDETDVPLKLDLVGLAVADVRVDGRSIPVQHAEGKLSVAMPGAGAGDTVSVSVQYQGVPDDGLVLGRNIHGRPTAFADNWPNRARYWFPSIDHPSDKASVSFSIEAPRDRQVIANGNLVDSDGGVWRWDNPEPIPTYTMVIGAASFAIERVAQVCDARRCIEVETWLFPPDTVRARSSFERAGEMVSYFSGLIAPFPYSKLAHVQSSTRFGGMENVSAIFYPERPLSEGRDIELTVAHETAHQWFGDAVTESDWRHLWLSEGFATYFAALFFEHTYGAARFREVMEESRQQYLASDVAGIPIVDESENNLFELLNANNYDKGAWVLHMLRRQLGEEAFFAGIRDYYRSFEHGVALTEDLQAALEEASGRDLAAFFRQWIYSPGHPRLRVAWSANGTVEVEQVQPAGLPAFRFPLTLEFDVEGEKIRRTVEVTDRTGTFSIELPATATAFRTDPDGDLLHEIAGIQKR